MDRAGQRDLVRDAVVAGRMIDGDDGVRTLDADVVREAALGLLTGTHYSRALRLRNVTIRGGLDLSDNESVLGLDLVDCHLDDGIDLHRATIGFFYARSCTFGSAVFDDVTCRTDVTAVSCTFSEGVSLVDARITGGLVVSSCVIDGGGFIGLDGERARVGGDLELGSTLIRSTRVVLQLRMATVDGDLRLREGHLHATEQGFCIGGERARVSGNVVARNAVVSARDGVALSWLSASVGGDFDFVGARISSAAGQAVMAMNSEFGSVDLGEATVMAHDETWAASFDNSTVRGVFSLGGALVSNRAGGCLSIVDCSIASLFVSRGARLWATDRPAIFGMQARIGRQLTIRACTLHSGTATAVDFDRLAVDGSAFFDSDAAISNRSEQPTIDLSNARVAGPLVVDLSNTVNRGSGLELSIVDSRVEGTLHFEAAAVLGRERLGRKTVSLDGLIYDRELTGSSYGEWARVIRRNTPFYAGQPYQQLAQTARAFGNERAATRVAVRQQVDLVVRGQYGGRLARLLHLTSGLLIGFGHRPWRALGWLVVNLAFAFVVYLSAARSGSVVDVRGQPGCDLLSQVSSAVKNAVPVLRLNSATSCSVDVRSPDAATFRVLLGLAQVIGWGLSTLFVAGFTGIVRRNK